MGLEHREVPQSPFCVLPYAQSTKQNQAAKLLDLLPKGGPKAFDVFVGALKETGQSHLAMELEKQDQAVWMEEETAIRVLFPIVQYLCN